MLTVGISAAVVAGTGATAFAVDAATVPSAPAQVRIGADPVHGRGDWPWQQSVVKAGPGTTANTARCDDWPWPHQIGQA